MYLYMYICKCFYTYVCIYIYMDIHRDALGSPNGGRGTPPFWARGLPSALAARLRAEALPVVEVG